MSGAGLAKPKRKHPSNSYSNSNAGDTLRRPRRGSRMGGAVIGKPCLKSTVKCRSTAGGDAHHRSNSRLPGGQYVQLVKQRGKGRVSGVKSRVIFGNPEQVYAALQRHTAYIECTNLTSRHMKGRLVRKTLGFSKRLQMLRAASVWEDVGYNVARQVKTLRLEVNDGPRRWLHRSPAMVAGLTGHIWSIEELLSCVPVPLTILERETTWPRKSPLF